MNNNDNSGNPSNFSGSPQAARGQRRPNLLPVTGKVPANNSTFEEELLGTILVQPGTLNDVVDSLLPESFYAFKHQEIYRAVLELFNNSESIDAFTVGEQLRRNGMLEKVGGAMYISQLSAKYGRTADNMEHRAKSIQELSLKRTLGELTGMALEHAFDDTKDINELLDHCETSIMDLQEQIVRKNFSGMASIVPQALKEIEERMTQKGDITGIPTGLKSLDKVTGGFQRSDLIIVAARPGMGKTSFVVSAVRNAAVDFDQSVAIFSLEMSSIQLVNRMMSSEVEIPSHKFRKADLSVQELQSIHSGTKRLGESKIFIDDTPGISLLELRSKCRRIKAKHGLDMVVIDYLQLMSGDSSSKRSGNREQEISMISRGLKGLAKDLDVPVIALSQLSRAVETRGGDKRPQLSDLRESGSIEQDADQVMFLFRPAYYDINEDEDGNALTEQDAFVILAKNRHGNTEDVHLKFLGQYTKFCDPNDFEGDGGPDMDDPLSGFDNNGTQTFSSRINNANNGEDSKSEGFSDDASDFFNNADGGQFDDPPF